METPTVPDYLTPVPTEFRSEPICPACEAGDHTAGPYILEICRCTCPCHGVTP